MSGHAPEDEKSLEPTSLARSRLAYDELLANQLALALVRANMRRLKGRSIEGDSSLCRKVLDTLPYALTSSQETALTEIKTDMSSDDRMMRLLQGDVGSGKTVVALMVMLGAVEAGYQTAIMAPTEILARQHFETIEPLAKAAGLEVVLLTGRNKGKPRDAILEKLASGAAHIAIGTHALFQDDVEFENLGLAVIDEQHRFGVHQRLTLAAKGSAVDMLVMTATPIPRTLMLTAYGDMDVSRLLEKPAGRKPIDTRVLPLERLDNVVDAIRRTVNEGSKVFWVCPLVEESEVIDAAAAEERYDHLKHLFGDRVGLVHGRMKGPEKDAVMEAFAKGNVDILVSTTVVEVGVDVPEATVMVIEHAERFGLAQLHQLRGRIGRGERPSTCLLLYAPPLTETARARLKILRETNDGFVIAEEDLRLRGAGELLGTRQSGLPEFRLADLTIHGELLATARDDAALILSKDPELKDKRGQALRTLLYLFERDAAVKFLQSG
jgi:ATP-dependent DNA helicase RecG